MLAVVVLLEDLVAEVQAELVEVDLDILHTQEQVLMLLLILEVEEELAELEFQLVLIYKVALAEKEL
jgi:hypothetical protein